MNKFNAIKLPFHRLHLLEFWGLKSDPKLNEANSLTAKIVLRKLWKDNLEPGKKVLSSIEADANVAIARVTEAIEESDTSLLGALFEAAKETRELVENGLQQDLKRKIILAFSELYYQKNTFPRPLVWVEVADRPQGITLAPRSGWQPAEPIEPTKEELRDYLRESGTKIPRRTYDDLLKKLGLSGPSGLKAANRKGAPSGKRKLSKKDFRK